MARIMAVGSIVVLLGWIITPAIAADAPDLSTPKKAAVTFAKAMDAGNLDAAKSASIGTDEDYRLVASMIGFLHSAKALQAEATAKFGDAGKKITGADPSDIATHIEASDEKIDGENATVGKPNEGEPMKLKKIDGVWKVDLAQVPNKESMAKAMPKMANVLSGVAAEIKQGTYKTAADARAALEQKMSAVLTEQAGPPPQGPDQK